MSVTTIINKNAESKGDQTELEKVSPIARFSAPLQAISSFVILFAAWEIGVRLFSMPTYILPAPSVVVTALMAKLPRVLDGAWITGQEIVVGYICAILVSIPLALCLALSRTLERMVFPVVVFFQIIPKVAIAPLFVIWFGFGLLPKILIVFLLAFFPMLANGISGFKSVPADIMEFARSTGAGRLLTFWKVRLPHALPSIFTGLKISAALSAIGAVVGEFVAADKGLGYLLLEYNGDIDTPMVFAVIVVLSSIGLLVYGTVALIERTAIPWHVSQRVVNDGAPAH
ncbi:MAG TPA: ABC transporter permease [Pseudolabrys sp.]|nr:ABC transporter permease [Pseudolabrys sp.]